MRDDTTDERISRLWPALILISCLILVGLTHGDYGITWDEAVQDRYGELVLAYFTSGLTDASCNSFLNLKTYGPLVDTVVVLFRGADPDTRYERRHLILGLLSTLVVPALYLYARRFSTPGVALLSLVALLFLPRFYGHFYANSKDMPFAVLTVWFFHALASVFVDAEPGRGRVVGAGLMMGLALCARPGAFPLLVLYLVMAALLAGWAGERARPLVGRCLVITLISWVVMVAPWPWAHEAPIAHPLEAMRSAASFAEAYPVRFAGTVVPSDQLPRSYVLLFLCFTTPVITLMLGLAGMASLGRPGRLDLRGREARLGLLTAGWLMAPLILFVVVRPNVYDGLRHFLFVLPPLAVFAGLGAAWLVATLRPRLGRLAPVLGALLLSWPVVAMVRLHPYQYTYFNAFVGGVGGAAGRFETDYWAASYGEALRWVNAVAGREPERRFVVAVAGSSYLSWVESYRAPNVRLVAGYTLAPGDRLPPGIDFYVATTRLGLDERYPEAPTVHRVGRDGAVFTVIKAAR